VNGTTLDFETFLIQPGVHIPKPVCLAIDVEGEELLHARFDRQACLDKLERALQGVLIGARVAFDLAVAALEWPELWEMIWQAYDDTRVFDVQIAEKLSDLHDGQLVWHRIGGKNVKVNYSLADIVQRRFNHTMDKNTYRLTYGTLHGTPIGDWERGAREYPLDDLRWTRKLSDKQFAAERTKLTDVWNQTRADWWMHLMVVRGFQLSRSQVERLEQSIVEDMERISARLRAAGLVRTNGKRDTKAAAARMVLHHVHAGTVPAITRTGKIQLTDEMCTDSKDPTLIDYARYTERVTTLAKVRALKDAAVVGMPIQSRFEVLLETGRTSCSGGKAKKGQDGPNRSAFGFQLQNVKKEPGLRECFVPRPGYVLASLDYGQLELCTWAQACVTKQCGDTLAKALNAGEDVHSMLGARLFKLDYEWVKANRKKDKKAAQARQAAKPLNFGLPGGMGKGGLIAYAKTQYGVVFTLAEAIGHIGAWKALWPEHRPYFEQIRRSVDNNEPVVQLFSDRVRGGCGFTDGCNTLFQGLASDAAKFAGYCLARACYTGSLRGAYIVNFVHDEFIFEFPEREAHEMALEAKRIMEAAAKEWIPDVPPSVEPALMRCWHKEAAPVWENGRLVPWEPAA
jgi:DNA polymerase-1